MIEHEPFTVQTRGRLYTTQDQRDRIGLDGKGVGESVQVGIIVVDRSPDWGTYSETATFTATVRTDGVIGIPTPVQSRLGLAVGDNVRATVRSAV